MKYIFCNIIFAVMISCSVQSPDYLFENAKKLRYEKDLKDAVINLESLIDKYPENELAAKAQFEIADIYLNDIKDFDFAIEKFKIVIKKYPDNDVSKKSLFMVAYIYNNYLDSYSDAIDNYNLFIDMYPDDELIPSVRFELEGLIDIKVEIDSLNSVARKGKVLNDG